MNFFTALRKFEIILASKSPRRQQLLNDLGIKFNSIHRDVDESYPSTIFRQEVALFLAEKKADAFKDIFSKPNTLVITADTIVCLGNLFIGKPVDFDDAVRILNLLSGKMHEVFTGVCISSENKKELFFVKSEVYFKKLAEEEIHFYINNFKPFDKAGAYGVQDWIGLTCIEKINGSFHNVMGLPVKEVYEHLLKFLPVQ